MGGCLSTPFYTQDTHDDIDSGSDILLPFLRLIFKKFS